MTTLTEIANKYKSDKGSKFFATDDPGHLYTEHYHQLFEHMRDNQVTLLEIGAAKGASLLMWNEYFQKGDIVGMDINLSLIDKNASLGVEGGGWRIANISAFSEGCCGRVWLAYLARTRQRSGQGTNRCEPPCRP